jgi:hypothetical protein
MYEVTFRGEKPEHPQCFPRSPFNLSVLLRNMIANADHERIADIALTLSKAEYLIEDRSLIAQR